MAIEKFVKWSSRRVDGNKELCGEIVLSRSAIATDVAAAKAQIFEGLEADLEKLASDIGLCSCTLESTDEQPPAGNGEAEGELGWEAGDDES